MRLKAGEKAARTKRGNWKKLTSGQKASVTRKRKVAGRKAAETKRVKKNTFNAALALLDEVAAILIAKRNNVFAKRSRARKRNAA